MPSYTDAVDSITVWNFSDACQVFCLKFGGGGSNTPILASILTVLVKASHRFNTCKYQNVIRKFQAYLGLTDISVIACGLNLRIKF